MTGECRRAQRNARCYTGDAHRPIREGAPLVTKLTLASSGTTADVLLPQADSDAAQIRAHIERVLASPPFARAPKMRRFLSFLVEETLAGRGSQLKEYTIGTSVFGKPDDFDPGTSAAVRVEAGRLRRTLEQYRLEHAAEDSLWVQIPKGSYVPTFSRFAKAGGALAPAPESAAMPGPLLSHLSAWRVQERRIVTALSCAFDPSAKTDITGDDQLALLEALHERCVEIGLRQGGDVEASASDRLMILFGWPNALEDAPGRALTSALEMVTHTQSLVGDQQLTVRIGIATSEVVARVPAAAEQRLRPAVIGEAPTLATRLQHRAASNAIFVSESTRRMSGTLFHFLPAGELASHQGGGLVWRLLRERSVMSRFRARHVGARGELFGRQEELALLMSRWRLSLEGEGQAAIILGEAGIGKSCLAESVLEQIGPTCIRLRVQCSPHHTNSALFPVLALLKRRLGLSNGWQDVDSRVPRALNRLGLQDNLDRDLLAALVSGEYAQDPLQPSPSSSLSTSQRKELTLKLLTRMVRALAELRAVAILVEDIHWADPTTLELLRDLIEAAGTARLLLVLTARPEVAQSVAQQNDVTAIRLTRLPRKDCTALLDRMAGAIHLLPSSRALILERSEGIPLYLEELTKLFLAIQPHELGPRVVPESLNDLLAVQMGQLGPTRRVAQIASALGPTFPRQMLSLAAGCTDAELDAALDQLLAAGILVRDRGDAAQTYTFRHALLRDAAYRSLLEATRRDLHRHVGNLLIESFPDIAAEQPELIAHHLWQGGRADESIPFWIDAGRRAASRYALAEAIAHLRMGLTILESLSDGDYRDRELALLIELGLAIRSAHGYRDEELQVIYERARVLAEQLGRPAQYAEAIYGLWTQAAGQGQWRSALGLAHQFEEQAGRLAEDDQLQVECQRLLGASAAFMGDFASARKHHERAVDLYDPNRHGPRFGFDPGVVAASYLSWTLWHLGENTAARHYANEALSAAEAKSHPPTLAMVLSWLTFYAVCEDDFDSIDRLNARLQSVCAERECRYWQPFGAACAEWAAFRRDGQAHHLEILLQNIAAFNERYLTSCLLLLAGYVCLKLERPQQGLEIVERAAAFIEEHDERIWEAGASRLQAELLHLSGADPKRIEALLHRALEIARRQGARPIEHFVLDSMARLGPLPEKKARARHH